MKADEGPHLIRMGLFLTVSLALLFGAVILLGRSQTLFAHRARLHTAFENTSGLVVGAPVRLAGVDIGIVESIRFDKDLRQKNVNVTLVVDRRYLDRVRDDSVARLSSKGLLGDMIINISVGSAEATPLRDGGTLRSQESEGLTEVVTSLQDGIAQIRALSATAQERIEHLITDDVVRDLGRIARATADVAEHVQSGGGLAHTIIYEPKLARDTAGLVADARRVASSAQAALDGVDHLVAEVEQGSGGLLASVSKSAADLDALLAEVRNGKGLLHSLVYERDRGNLLDNLTALSTTLRRLGDEVQEGKGTVGALLKDPSVYEDLKTILGNIKRNKLLRAIIRMEIKSDGLRATP